MRMQPCFDYFDLEPDFEKNKEEKFNQEYIGKQYGRLTILEKDKEKSKEEKRAWVKAKCDCGNEIITSLNSLRRGNTTSCGCLWKERMTELHMIDLTGQKIGRLTVLERDEDIEKEGYVFWKCQCECGNLVTVSSDNLGESTFSCGCLQKEIAREMKLKDLTNQRFGKLVALERDDSKQRGHKTYWKCQCDCGNITYVQTSMLSNGNTSSCGCRKQSYGEEQIEKILKNNQISYQREYIFPDLRGDFKPLRFDFAIFLNNELKYLIECQGPQHFKQIDYFKRPLEYTQEHDNLKRQYCQEHNIPLIEIDFKKNRIIKEEEVVRKELL